MRALTKRAVSLGVQRGVKSAQRGKAALPLAYSANCS